MKRIMITVLLLSIILIVGCNSKTSQTPQRLLQEGGGVDPAAFLAGRGPVREGGLDTLETISVAERVIISTPDEKREITQQVMNQEEDKEDE